MMMIGKERSSPDIWPETLNEDIDTEDIIFIT